jgi:GNAT superfamily N-acetyltransferase
MLEAPILSQEDAPVKCERIRTKHCLLSFSCGDRGIDQHARKTAYKLDASGRSRVIAAYNDSVGMCCGYVSLAFARQTSPKLLEQQHRDMWSSGAPVIHIDHLGVDRRVQRQGNGTVLLIAALKAAHSVSKIVPVYGVSLNSLNDRTTEFYKGMGFRIAPEERANPLMMLDIWSINGLFD